MQDYYDLLDSDYFISKTLSAVKSEILVDKGYLLGNKLENHKIFINFNTGKLWAFKNKKKLYILKKKKMSTKELLYKAKNSWRNIIKT